VAGSQLVLALSFLLPQSTCRSYLTLAAMLLFVAFVQGFIGTLIWLLPSEIFPLAIRGFAMGMAVLNIGSVIFVAKFVPETRGRTLEELEDDFRDHRAGEMSHRAPSGVRGS